MTTKPIKLLIVDDHSIFLDGLELLLGTQENLNVVAKAKNGQDALQKLKTHSIDVVISDLSMPVQGGISFIGEASVQFPEIKFLALTMLNDYASVKETLEAGADVYLLKNTSAQELNLAIETVSNGNSYLSNEINQLMIKSIHLSHNSAAAQPNSLALLTPREKEITQLIVSGLASKAIGQELDISLDTVKFHRKNILSKLNAPNVASLVSLVVEQGLFKN